MCDRSPARAREDYVKVIYQLGARRPVRAADVARCLGVSRASVSKFKRMLQQQRLLEPTHGRGDGLRLTPQGRRLGRCMVRRHRLVETFLHATLQVPLERVHREAERIEHAISDDVSARLARFLGHPARDPHGHAILGEGAGSRGVRPLWHVSPGSMTSVAAIDDHDPAVVARLARYDILPQRELTVVRRTPQRIVVLAGGREIALGRRAAERIWCRLWPTEGAR